MHWLWICVVVVGFLGKCHAITDCVDQADMVFLVDSSLSIRNYVYADRNDLTDNWHLLKTFISELVFNLPVAVDGVRIGLVLFATEVSESHVIYLDNRQSKDALRHRIMQLPYLAGNTNTSGALRFMRRNLFGGSRGDRETVKNIGFLITDGLSNIDTDSTVPEAREAKNAGIQIFTLGITKFANEAELQEIGSDPVSYYYFLARDFKNLPYLQDQVLSHLCKSKPPPPTPCKDSRGDLVLILDTSGSISDKNPENSTGNFNWDLLIDFSISVVESLNIGRNKTRLSVIRFSEKAEVMFHLDKYYEASDMVEVIRGLHYLSGATNTSGALRVLRTEVFSKEHGDRPDVRNVGIIITDGESTKDVNLTIPEAIKTKEAKIRMFAVGLTNDISEEELTEIASSPTNEHFFERTAIDEVDTLVSRLIWSVCHDPCDDSKHEGKNIPGYGTICARYEDGAICNKGEELQWESHPGHLLVGHNYARLTHISTPEDCQLACLQDQNCRSVDYVRQNQECAVSYITKDKALTSFAADENVDYYEWHCVYSNGSYANPDDGTQPGSRSTGPGSRNPDGSGPGEGGRGGSSASSACKIPVCITTSSIFLYFWISVLSLL